MDPKPRVMQVPILQKQGVDPERRMMQVPILPKQDVDPKPRMMQVPILPKQDVDPEPRVMQVLGRLAKTRRGSGTSGAASAWQASKNKAWVGNLGRCKCLPAAWLGL